MGQTLNYNTSYSEVWTDGNKCIRPWTNGPEPKELKDSASIAHQLDNDSTLINENFRLKLIKSGN
jgi:hypothetical protein